MLCSAPSCQRQQVLLHEDKGYCVWHYRALPNGLLRRPWLTP